MRLWILALIACLVFASTYNPRTGNLNKFLKDADNSPSFSGPQVSVEDDDPEPSSSAPRVRTKREA